MAVEIEGNLKSQLTNEEKCYRGHYSLKAIRYA